MYLFLKTLKFTATICCSIFAIMILSACGSTSEEIAPKSDSILQSLKTAGVKIESTRPVQINDCSGLITEKQGTYFLVSGSTQASPVDGCLFFFDSPDDLNDAKKAIISANKDVGRPTHGPDLTGVYDTGTEVNLAYYNYQHSFNAAIDQSGTAAATYAESFIQDYPEYLADVYNKPDAKKWFSLELGSYWIYDNEENIALVCSFNLAANQRLAIKKALHPK